MDSYHLISTGATVSHHLSFPSLVNLCLGLELEVETLEGEKWECCFYISIHPSTYVSSTGTVIGWGGKRWTALDGWLKTS